MNKKVLGMGLAALMLAACANNGAAGDQYKATVAGEDGTEYTANLTVEDGKVTGVSIDAVDAEGNSKKEQGANYGMAKASGIQKEWFEQIGDLEGFIIANGVDAVKMDAEGYAENEDLKTGCTINIKPIMEAVDQAYAESQK